MRKKEKQNKEIEKKLEYIGLKLDDIPQKIKEFEPLEYRIVKYYDDKQYRQYRFVPIKNIQILISQTNRLDSIEEKYKKARPLYEYLDNKNDENVLKYTTFLKMLNDVKIEDIEKVEQEQLNLSKKVPFKVKYEGNYLWQIYYSENTDKYFMIVTTEDTDYSTFFYLIKKQLEERNNEKIFVPISNVQYSTEFFRKSEFENLENYLWLFTKDWPLIYEVYDKRNKLSIQIVGETNVYENLKTIYKINLKTKEEASEFYKILKILFILQSEFPHYYNFKTNIDKSGKLEFYLENEKIEYDKINEFIKKQFELCEEKRIDTEQKIEEYNKKLEDLKKISTEQEIEYLSKEKQISTFLQCKKSFFGKVKYFFKYSKKSSKKEETVNSVQEENNDNEKVKKRRKRLKENYTLEELIEQCKKLELLETDMNNLLMDINALKLKNKNMAKKIENATNFIEEIDKHRKSIFEFWKYSNKDEVSVLPEGEQEEINVIKRIEKTFDYIEDKEAFGEKVDKIQRASLTKEETDSVYIATTELLDMLNKIKLGQVTPQEIETNLKEMKKEAIKAKELTEEEFDIFGGIVDDKTKVRKIKNKKHRELPKDKFSILEINKNTKQIGYKLTLEQVVKNIMLALEKGVIPENLAIYKAIPNDELDKKKINVFNINPEEEIKENINKDANKINLYKINIKEGTKGIAFTNNIFYDNQNKTLPVGMDLSNKLLVDISKLHIKIKNKTSFKIISFENEKDDFSPVVAKNITLFEYDSIDIDDLKEKKDD